MKDCLLYNSSEINPVHLINALLISIVLFLHHGSYMNNYFHILSEYKINMLLQKISVGGFFFFSGLKLTISNFDLPAHIFLKKRVLRIYILYLFALIIASFTSYPFLYSSYPTLSHFLMHAFCFQTILPNFFQKNFHTLWFVPILLPCYMVFIFTRRDILDIKKFIGKQQYLRQN